MDDTARVFAGSLGEPGRGPEPAAAEPRAGMCGALNGVLELASDWYWEHDTRLQFRWVPQPRRAERHDGQRWLQQRCDLDSLVPRSGNWDDYMIMVAERQCFRDYELVCRCPDGSVEYIVITGEPVYDERGVFAGYHGVGRDVTEQIRNEQLLRIEHEVTRQLADAATGEAGLTCALSAICLSEGWACGEYWYVDESAGALRFGGYWDNVDDHTRAVFERARGFIFPPGVGLAGRVWQSGEPLWVADVNTDNRMLRKDLAREAGLHGAFLFPTFAAGQVIGVFAFWSQAIRKPDERLMTAIAVIGSQVGQFVRRKHAEQVLRDSEMRFRALTELSSDWYWEQDLEGRFTRMEGRGAEKTASYIGKRGEELGFVAEGGWPAHYAVLDARLPFRDLVLSLQVGSETRFLNVSGAPVTDADGYCVGYRGVTRDITERKRAEERIRYLAMHDGLTGLPNRVMFSQILIHSIETSRRYDRKFAVLFIDLDRFKTINDTLGHEAGDALLCEISSRLKHALRASDVVARLGGDEFVVLLQETPTEGDVTVAARKILSACMKPIVIKGQECRVTASIGISMYPADADDEQSLMKNADIAMYMAKEAGKNNFQRYTRESKSQALEKMAIETNLRRALERNEFTLHYQAKLDLVSNGISGVEALLRWNNEELGSVSPGQFIPIAEETGLIVPIGKWVLRTACMQSVAWQKQGLPPVCMAVNLSPRQFSDPALVSDLDDLLRDTGLEPRLLELEITESMVMHDTERTIRLLQEIKALGISLAIDDFGTGYSSLAQLRRFPIDTLKVDRSFIREITSNAEDKAITEAIITMGKTLSLTVVAEGVETQEQMAMLRDKSCDQMQGYHFSKPVAPDEFAELMRAHCAATPRTAEAVA